VQLGAKFIQYNEPCMFPSGSVPVCSSSLVVNVQTGLTGHALVWQCISGDITGPWKEKTTTL